MPARVESPEELDTLLEDGFVLRDAAALAELFESTGILVADAQPAARGRVEIRQLCARLCRDGRGYVADANHVLVGPDIAVVVGDDSLHVARRGQDRSWRYAVAVLTPP